MTLGHGDDATCLLDVPTHKTGGSYTKPVDPLVGKAFAVWEAQRKPQPLFIDRKTGERVALVFAWRGRSLATQYFNKTMIPLLCRKAGVPQADARGRITSHRARATIASQLYNAKEPMTLSELQAWLGHRSPETTQHYGASRPRRCQRPTTTLAISLGTCARSRYSSIETRSTAAPRQQAPHGNTSTLVTVCAPTAFSSSVHIAWRARVATSTFQKVRPKSSCWRRRGTCSGCSPRSN